MAFRQVKFYRVLWRGHLIFGGERELVLFTTVVAVVLPVWGLTWTSAIAGILVWITAMPALQWMAKHDPQFSQVYRRHIQYLRHYEARSRPYRINYS